MFYVVIVIRDRSLTILTDHRTKKKYFTDLALAHEKLYRDFSQAYIIKTGKPLTKEEFNSMKGICTDWFGIDKNGDSAWINNVGNYAYDIQILKIQK